MTRHWPGTIYEAVTLLLSTMSDEEKESLKATPRVDLITYHFSLGHYIRNAFGLWQGNDDLLQSCYPEVTDPQNLEYLKLDIDGASRRIVEALWEKVREDGEKASRRSPDEIMGREQA